MAQVINPNVAQVHNVAGKNGAKGSTATNKPRIDAGRTDIANVTREIWGIINTRSGDPLVYYQEASASLVYLVPEINGTSTIVQATPEFMAYTLSDQIRFYKQKNKSRGKTPSWTTVKTKVPLDLVRLVLGNPPPEVPRLRGIANTPYFTKTRRLVEKPGYDKESGWYLKPIINVPPVPCKPTHEQVEQAKKIIDQIIQDFQFEVDADRANLLALMLGLLAREMIDGPTPIHLIEAATPGTGKSLVVQALLSALLGTRPTMRAEPRDDAEWAKVIVSAMLSGERLFVVDNINNSLMSGTLSNAVVSSIFSARILGRNKDIKGEIRWSWVMTGNNVTATMEVARRIVRTRMTTPEERPWEREQDKFHIPKLMRWVDEHSGLICWSALTLVQSWIATGAKEGKGNLGSFEHWAEVMSGILDNVGIKGFLGNVSESFDDMAEETASWSEFVKAWWNLHTNVPHSASDLYTLLAIHSIDLNLHGDNAAALTISLGKALSLQKDKVFGEYRIVKGKGSDRRLWHLEKVKS